MKLFLSLLFIVGILFPQGSLFAVSEQRGITVSPAFQEIILDQKGESQDFSVSVTNDTDTVVTLKLSIFDFGSLDESGGVAFLGASDDLEKKYALASWMRLEKDTLFLPPGETGTVRVTIENRDSLSPGGHYGALTFKIENDTTLGGTGSSIAVNQLFTALVFVKKVGGEIYDLKLGGQEYESSSTTFGDVLRLRFQNSGNVHLTPRGVVYVTDPFSRTVRKGIINQESALILPETFRVYQVSLNMLAPVFIPGNYTVSLAYRYDGKEEFVTVTETHFFIPPLFISGAIFLLVGGTGTIFFLRRRKSHPLVY